MKKSWSLITAVLFAATALVAPANAASMSFTVDGAPNSFVSVDSNSVGCAFGSCSLSAELAYSTPLTFSVDEGSSHSFNFARFEIGGGAGFGSADISATLAFLDPSGISASTGAEANYLTFFGVLSGGSLSWTNPNQTFTVDGSTFNVSFGNLLGITGNTAYAPVTVSVSSISSVPEPAAWVMMITGFGLVGATMRKRQKGVVLA